MGTLSHGCRGCRKGTDSSSPQAPQNLQDPLQDPQALQQWNRPVGVLSQVELRPLTFLVLVNGELLQLVLVQAAAASSAPVLDELGDLRTTNAGNRILKSRLLDPRDSR